MASTDPSKPVNFYVWASASKKYFNLGRDLALFVRCIQAKDRPALMDYATRCIDCVYARLEHYNSPRMITLSLVQGDALGGGFEAALSSDVVIAEEQACFGFPEVRFNSFPGMGAYSLLARKVGRPLAEKMLLSGERFSARTMQEWGLVDQVVARGAGIAAVRDYAVATYDKILGISGVYRARQAVNPITRAELMTITTHWVDAAMNLLGRDVQLMRQLVERQLKSQRAS